MRTLFHLFTLIACAAMIALNHRRIHELTATIQKNMDAQTAALTELKNLAAKVGKELTTKIDKLIAAQGGLSPDAQKVADEMKADLTVLDNLNPDEPPAEEPPTGEQATS